MTWQTADAQRQALGEAVAAIRARNPLQPEAVLVLGTGLSGVAAEIEAEESIPYTEIPHFPESTVQSHAGQLVLGRLGGRAVVAFQGRFHRYEGYSLQQVVLPVRVGALLGARTLVVCAACGGLDPLWACGDLSAIDDHINLLGDNPLIGPNLDELGARFPDMSMAYDRELISLAEQVALDQRIVLRRGVYAAVPGPNLETRAEYRMLRSVGADMVGMSTVPEVIAARHAGMRVLGIGIVTNICLPDALEPTDVEAVIRTARSVEGRLAALVRGVLERM